MMLAGDLGLDATLTDLSGPVTSDDVPAIATVNNFDSGAEGEDTPEIDLVAFAKALTDAGVQLFGAAWCPACNTQKELFEDGADFLPFVEVTNPDRTQNQIGIDENITAYPTWEFGDGSREVGVFSLEAIAQLAQVPIPTSTQPFIAPLEDRVLFAGSPLHIALNGYDPNGGELTYTIESSNPGLVTPTLLQGNRSASIYYAGWGEVVVQLFEGRAPTQRAASSRLLIRASTTSPTTTHRSSFIARSTTS